MKLSHVAIQNYLSIKYLEIAFEPTCRILVGINESGKTNILKALNLLSPSAVATRRDLREAGRRESPIKSAFVRFAFNFTQDEASQIFEQAKSIVLSKTYENPIINIGDKQHTLEEFCNSRQGLYKIDILTGNKVATTWSLDKAQLSDKLMKVSAACPADFVVPGNQAEQISLKKYAFVDTSEFPDIPSEYLTQGTSEDFSTLISPFIKSKVVTNLLKVLFWDYQESMLLPPKINLDQFCTKPESCVPLQRMFQLHKVTDIQKEVADAKGGGPNALANLLRHVAETTSDHFHRTWKEYEQVQFSLTMDGPDLVAGIEDEANRYALAQRSDGFKRFVTFLLLVSAEQATDLLKDTLLLIDEPEIGLHPTGARYLREELIKISTNNYVMFSTHSIFMVDDGAINRHLIVRKNNEITQIEQVTESNIREEEVIYRALGYSIFSTLKERNLIFEGWRDKKLFETAISTIPPEYEDVRSLAGLGRCFAQGAKQIKCITPLFEAGNRRCLILTDNDEVARRQQEQYVANNGYGTWRRYNEILNGAVQVTGEDFLTEATFAEPLRRLAERLNIAEQPLAALDTQGGRIQALRNWMTRNGVAQDQIESSIRRIKEDVFTNLQATSIRTEYFDYLRALLPLVQAL